MTTSRPCLTCGRTITPAQWLGLRHLTTQRYPAEEPGEPAMELEWRACSCGNSVSVDLEDPDYELFAVLSSSARGAV
jgi:hypothetical protein